MWYIDRRSYIVVLFFVHSYGVYVNNLSRGIHLDYCSQITLPNPTIRYNQAVEERSIDRSIKQSKMHRRGTERFARTSWLPWVVAMIMATSHFAAPNSSSGSSSYSDNVGVVHALAPAKVYRYFGYGSNVIPSTMKTLRQIEVREAMAAVLPDYELRFKSAAFVRPVPMPMAVNNRSANDNSNTSSSEEKTKDKDGINDDNNGLAAKQKLPLSGKVVHGLVYTLTEHEFAKVGSTEGVPFGYRWKSCFVYPYRGDGKQAGADSLNDPNSLPIQAYTLVEPKVRNRIGTNTNTNNDDEIPSSASYLGLIREGARLWKFDKSYQDELATIQVAKSNNMLFPDGWEGPTLQLAEKVTGTKRTYMIDGY